jgi:hypothetical protein
MQRDWNLLATSSHYNTAVAVYEELRAGNIENAITGLEELIEALCRSDERAIENYLTRLMQHIIKWKLQPERRTPSWVSTIRYARRQIRKLQKENPRFTDDWIRAVERAVGRSRRRGIDRYRTGDRYASAAELGRRV